MSSANLLSELRQYLHREVEIPQHEQTLAKQAVETIKGAFQQFQHQSLFDFRQIFHQGSIYEGLKVIAADEFDLLVPLKLNTSGWRISTTSAAGYYKIEKQSISADVNGSNLTEHGILIPAKVRQNMHSVVQRAVNGMTVGMEITVKDSGPAITLNVKYSNGRQLSIDIVPALVLHGRNFVAKSPKSLRHLRDGVHEQFWRESFSQREKDIFNNIDRMNKCHKDCLKILKTIQKKRGSSQLGMLSSYHLKTCMLHLDHDQTGLSWNQDRLADRFKDLLNTLINFLENRRMPNFFCTSVNLLDGYDGDSLNNILRWLRGATRDDYHIIDILLHEKGFNRPIQGTFDIFVKNQEGKSKVYQNMQNKTTVRQLKQKIKEREGIPVDQQRLTFESRPLEDQKTLGYYNIQENSTIYLLGRLRGGLY